MAKSLRVLKRDIDYLISAVVSDCYTCMVIGDKPKEEILTIVEDAINARNSFIDKANHPAEKKNKHLVKKHYASLRREIMDKVDELFAQLSDVCKGC
ncbi:MAG: hypothetical protein R3Y50_04200 [Rikenellaceae bacterium]